MINKTNYYNFRKLFDMSEGVGQGVTGLLVGLRDWTAPTLGNILG